MDIPLRPEPTQHYNCAADLLDGNCERGQSSKVAVKIHGSEWSYGQLVSGANRVGNALRQLGAEKGDRIFIALSDGFEFATAFFGSIKIGAVPSAHRTDLTHENYAYLFEHTSAMVAVVSQEVAEEIRRFRREMTHLKHVIVVGGDPAAKELGFEEVAQEASDLLTAADTRSDDICFLQYTSGTTGRPEAVVRRQYDLRAFGERYGTHILAMTQEDSLFSVAKLDSAYGLHCIFGMGFTMGASACLMAEASASPEVAEAVRRLRPTIYFGTPTNFAAMLALPYLDLRSVRTCICSGEPLRKSLAMDWKARCGLELINCLGTAEAGGMFLSNRTGDAVPESVGRVVPGYEVKLVDENGIEVADGQAGSLLVRGESVCREYWKSRKGSMPARFVAGWYVTGNVCARDERGYFYFKGRSDDMFKVGAMWVSPLEVEAAIDLHPAVVESAVIGIPDREGVAAPEAYVVVQPEIAFNADVERQLRAHLARKLPSRMRPRAFHAVGALPKTPTGRIQRSKLRKEREASAT